MSTIQWYPGHMARAKRLVREHIDLVDVVLELIDARIPMASRNPDIAQLIGSKPHLIILNKADLADPLITEAWQKYFRTQKVANLAVATTNGLGLNRLPQLANQLAAEALQKWRSKGRRPRSARLMILGIPNVGKSTLINRLVGQKRLKVADRAGVTRQQQWVKLRGDLDLLDMPGILMPKIGDDRVGLKLAATGAISDEVYDLEYVARWLASWLYENHEEAFCRRYNLDKSISDAEQLLLAIGASRGALVSGGKIDTKRAAWHLLDEFRDGRIGRFSLEMPVLPEDSDNNVEEEIVSDKEPE